MRHPEWRDLARDADDLYEEYPDKPMGFWMAFQSVVLLEIHDRLMDMQLRDSSDDDDLWRA